MFCLHIFIYTESWCKSSENISLSERFSLKVHCWQPFSSVTRNIWCSSPSICSIRIWTQRSS